MLRKLSLVVVACILFTQFTQLLLAQQPAGPEHEVLKRLEGTWDAEVKTLGDQGGVSKAESVSKMGVGGQWLITDFKGEFGPIEFQGHGVDGYDRDKKKYVSVWVDSMSAAPMVLEGDYDAEKKTLTLTGEGKGPDGSPAKYKSVTEFKDDDHHEFTLYLLGADDEETPLMTIAYTRRK